MTDDEDERHIVEYDPDDQGTGEVQANGMLYVGREYAGESVRWLIEGVGDDDA